MEGLNITQLNDLIKTLITTFSIVGIYVFMLVIKLIAKFFIFIIASKE